MPIKVVHVVQNYFPSKGGTQTLFKEISERLVRNYGDDVTVCTTNSYYGPEKKIFKKIALEEEEINGAKIKRFDFYRFHQGILKAGSKVAAKLGFKVPPVIFRYIHGPWSPLLNKFLIETNASVICASSHAYMFMHYPLLKAANKPFIFVGAIHFKDEDNGVELSKRTLDAIKRSRFYIANTGFEKQKLVQYGVEAHKIKVIGCGVDIQAFTPKSSGEQFRMKYNLTSAPIVAYVGRHEPSKGIDTLVYAMESLWAKGRNYQLIIAGSNSEYTNKLQNIVNNLHQRHQANITFITNFSDEEKVDIYNNLDVFVSVSTSESFGIVFLEAWACKKPVIAANVGAVRSVVSDNQDGYLIQPGDAQELSQKIDELCLNQEKRDFFGANGFKKTVNNYTWDIITAKYRELYEQATEVVESEELVSH